MVRGVLACALGVTLAACQALPGMAPERTPAATIGLPTPWPTETSRPTALPFEPTLTIQPSLQVHQEQGLRPGFASDAERDSEWTRYTIEVEVAFDPDAEVASIDGQARIRFTNPSSRPLLDLELMLWPNDPQYRAEMTAGPALIDGGYVEAASLLGGMAISLPLTEPLPSGETIDVSLPFHIETSGPIGGATPKRFGITQGILVAPTFYPLVPRLVDGGWEVEPAPPGGDTTNSETALYDLTIHAPRDFGVTASGVEIEQVENPDGTQTVRSVTGPMRDVAFAIGPFETAAVMVEDVELRAWFLPEHAEAGREMLEAARLQYQTLTELVGPYPYPELDLVDAPGAFGGIEYPGLVFIGTLGGANVVEPTVHEVAHQWFYGLIGDDQLHEPWLDEAAATYAEVLYYEDNAQRGRATSLLSDFRALLRSYPDSTLPIGLGVGEYADEQEYALFVYVKGALFFDALRRELRDPLFGDFLKLYFQTYRYEIATGEDFQQVAEDACACDLDDLFNLWVWQGGRISELE